MAAMSSKKDSDFQIQAKKRSDLGLVQWKAKSRQLSSEKWQAERRKKLTEAIVGNACRDVTGQSDRGTAKKIGRGESGNLYYREMARLEKSQQKITKEVQQEKMRRNKSKMSIGSRSLTRSMTSQSMIKVKTLRFDEKQSTIQRSSSMRRMVPGLKSSNLNVKSYHHLINSASLTKSLTFEPLQQNEANYECKDDKPSRGSSALRRESSIDPYLAEESLLTSNPMQTLNVNEIDMEQDAKRVPLGKIAKKRTQNNTKHPQERVRELQRRIEKKSTDDLLKDLQSRMSKQQSTVDNESNRTPHFFDF